MNWFSKFFSFDFFRWYEPVRWEKWFAYWTASWPSIKGDETFYFWLRSKNSFTVDFASLEEPTNRAISDCSTIAVSISDWNGSVYHTGNNNMKKRLNFVLSRFPGFNERNFILKTSLRLCEFKNYMSLVMYDLVFRYQ